MEEDHDIPIILGRPFLATGNAIINVSKRELSLEVENEKVTFTVFKALKDPLESKACCQIATLDKSVTEKNLVKAIEYPKEPDKASKVHSKPPNADSEEFKEFEHHKEGGLHYYKGRMPKFKNLRKNYLSHSHFNSIMLI